MRCRFVTRVQSTIFALAISILGVAAAIEAAAPIADFDLPPQALADSLRAVAVETQTSVLFDADVVLGRRAPALKARVTVDEAVERLLVGSGLAHRRLDDRTIVLAPAEVAGKISNPGELRGHAVTQMQVVQVDDPADAERPSLPRDPEQTSGAAASAEIQEVVVTAQKREERLQDVPISISVLSGEELDRSTVQGITEALGRVPGVGAFAHSQGGGTFVTVRGVAASGPVFAGSGPISYYLDSVPFGLVQSAFAPDANAYDLERVEVLRGPQGTLYGANAQGGVVRVLTKDANLNAFELKARALTSSTKYGGWNYRGDLALNAPIIEGKLAARMVVGYEDLSGWIDTPIGNDGNDAKLRNYRLKVNAQPTDALSISLLAWRTDDDFGASSAADDNRFRNISVEEQISTSYNVYGLEIGYEFPSFSVSSMTSYLDDYTNGGVLDLGSFVNFQFPLDLLTAFDASVFSQEVNLASTHQGPWSWTAGTIYRDGKDVGFQAIPVTNPLLSWTNTSQSYAIFGEISRRFFGDKLQWTLGGRYFHDQVETKEGSDAPLFIPPLPYRAANSFNSTTPRAVLTWYPSESITVYGSYAEGFRSGTPQPYYVTGGVAGFPPVDPDTLHNYEIGAKGSLWNDRVEFETALYYIDWQDVQQQLVVICESCNGVFVTAIVNAESASGLGFDFGVTLRPAQGLELGANLSWNDLTFDSDVLSGGTVLYTKGSRPSFSPEYTFGTSADYVFPLGQTGFKGRLSLSANYRSEQGGIFSPSGTGAGDSMLIGRTSFSIQAPNRWEATVFADNVTNWQKTMAGSGLDAFPVRTRPRTIGIQLEYRY